MRNCKVQLDEGGGVLECEAEGTETSGSQLCGGSLGTKVLLGSVPSVSSDLTAWLVVNSLTCTFDLHFKNSCIIPGGIF